jgi:hypothetical protein
MNILMLLNYVAEAGKGYFGFARVAIYIQRVEPQSNTLIWQLYRTLKSLVVSTAKDWLGQESEKYL